MRYSGSPLAYSFSEADHRKGSWLVDLGADGRRPPPSSSTRRSPGRWPGCAAPLDDLLADPALAVHEDVLGAGHAHRRRPPAQAMERLRRRFPHTLRARLRARGARPASTTPAGPHAGRSDHDIALDFVAELRGAPASAAESALLLEAVRRLLRRTPTSTPC